MDPQHALSLLNLMAELYDAVASARQGPDPKPDPEPIPEPEPMNGKAPAFT